MGTIFILWYTDTRNYCNLTYMFRQLYFYITVCAIAVVSIGILGVLYRFDVFAGDGSVGDPYTVCAVGCDYTSISEALTFVSDNDYIEVLETYSSSTESWPLQSNSNGITISCESTNVIIGPTTTIPQSTIALRQGNTISGCTLSATNNPGSASYIGGEENSLTFLNNNIIDYQLALPTSSIVSNNLITFEYATSSMINVVSGVQVVSNTIQYLTDEDPSGAVAIFSDGGGPTPDMSNAVIASNTIMVGPLAHVGVFAFYSGGQDVEVRGNKIQLSGQSEFSNFFYHRNLNHPTSLLFTHNTIYVKGFQGTNSGNVLFAFSDDDQNFVYPVSITSTYNMFYADSTGTSSAFTAFTLYPEVASSSFYEDFNVYAGQFEDPAFSVVAGGADVGISSGGNSVTQIGAEPLRTHNIDTEDDFELVPYSRFINVNGSEDVGAIAVAERGSSFTIDDDCAIDYTTCVATSSAAITNNIQSSDTWYLAAGVYEPFQIGYPTGSSLDGVAVIGAGADTIIRPLTSSEYVVSMVNLTSGNLEQLVLQDASSTIYGNYELTNALYEYNGTSYNDDLGLDPDTALVLYDATGCDIVTWDTIYEEDGGVAVPIVYDGVSDWNLVVAQTSAFGPTLYFTLFVPDNVASSPGAALAGACTDFGITIDQWVDSAFVNTDGAYAYDAAAVQAAGLTLLPGYTDPPSITAEVLYGTGLHIEHAGSIIISGVTSTGNQYALSMMDTIGTISIVSSTLDQSSLYDVLASTTDAHIFQNVWFNSASSTVSGAGSIEVRYTSQVYVENASSTPLSGVSVTYQSAKGASEIVTTGLDGYSAYTTPLTTMVLSAGGVGPTAGGHNPFSVTAAATSTYVSTSTSDLITEPGQAFILTMLESSGPATAPTDATIVTTTDSTITVAWTDTSDNESVFLIDYILGNDTADFPGTTSTVGANTTSTTLFVPIANAEYTVRVAAVNDSGTTAYSTTTAAYTHASVPGKVSLVTSTDTTLTLEFAPGNNATGTLYELVDVTGATTTIVTTTDTTYVVTGLTPETSYTYKTRAQYLDGSETWTDYSGPETLSTIALDVSEEEEEEDEEDTPSSSRGGSSYIPISTPRLPAGMDAMSALRINDGDTTTAVRTVSLAILATHAVEMAISNSNDFSGVSYIPFASTATHVLTAGIGEKRVYVKLRSQEGGTLTITDSILLTGERTDQVIEAPVSSQNCPVSPDSAIKTADTNTIYYITTRCTKLRVPSPALYFTYFTTWNSVQLTTQTIVNSIPAEPTGFFPYGPLYRPQYGALVKQPFDPKVYLILNDTKYWITSPDVFETLGYEWSWIEGVDPRFLDKYPTGSEITDMAKHPNYTIVKYANSPRVYRLEPSSSDTTQLVKRWIPDEATFVSLQFRWDRILTIPQTFVYSDGPSMTRQTPLEVSGSPLQIPPEYQFTTQLQLGDRGLVVVYLQDRLKQLGFFPVDIRSNGVFGPTTELSVRTLQQQYGITVNGYVGPETRAILNR